MYTAQTHIDSPLGRVLLARTAQGLSGLWFVEGQRDFPGAVNAPTKQHDPLFRAVQEQLQRYWAAPAGAAANFDIPLDLVGTVFQEAVWRALLTIAHGDLCSYGDIARRLGNPQANRAVGMAVGRNPISIIVPCHRVVGHDTQLTGYSGGLHRKIALLTQEGHVVHDNRLHRPPPGQALLV